MGKKIETFMLKFLSIICFIIAGIGFLSGVVTLPIGLILIAIGVLFLFLGLWSWKRANAPATGKQTTKKPTAKKQGLEYGLNYVYVNKNSKVYHDDVQCRSVKPGFDMITWDKAESMGLTRCKFCHK